MGLAVLAVVVLLGFFLVAMYNSLVQLRVRSDSAWSDIDVQLKRRHDLIPNLVETVKGYAAHEKGTFENIAKFRSMAMSTRARSHVLMWRSLDFLVSCASRKSVGSG